MDKQVDEFFEYFEEMVRGAVNVVDSFVCYRIPQENKSMEFNIYGFLLEKFPNMVNLIESHKIIHFLLYKETPLKDSKDPNEISTLLYQMENKEDEILVRRKKKIGFCLGILGSSEHLEKTEEVLIRTISSLSILQKRYLPNLENSDLAINNPLTFSKVPLDQEKPESDLGIFIQEGYFYLTSVRGDLVFDKKGLIK